MSQDCIFCKIGRGEIPAAIIYQDDEFVAFRDINAQAPVHALVIPRAHTPSIMDANDSAKLGRALAVVQRVAEQENVHNSGFRTVINHKDEGVQNLLHIHNHVLGGRFMSWTPG